MTRFGRIERRIIVGSRYMAMLAVLGSLLGAALMFVLGLFNIFEAIRISLPGGAQPAVEPAADGEAAMVSESLAVISVIEGLDRFLIAIVLLYFCYGVYSLFIRPGHGERELALPEWLRVKQIGQLKQVVAEVIIVILFVLFLRVVLQVFQEADVELSWAQIGTIMMLPVATLFLGTALRLVQLHPKPLRPQMQDEQPVERDPDDETRPE